MSTKSSMVDSTKHRSHAPPQSGFQASPHASVSMLLIRPGTARSDAACPAAHIRRDCDRAFAGIGKVWSSRNFRRHSMTSLVITDGLLSGRGGGSQPTTTGASHVGASCRHCRPGALRFSDLLPLPTPTVLLSFSASSAFLLMAVSTIWTSSAGATRGYASILLIAPGAAGFVMADLFELTGSDVVAVCVADFRLRSQTQTAEALVGRSRWNWGSSRLRQASAFRICYSRATFSIC